MRLTFLHLAIIIILAPSCKERVEVYSGTYDISLYLASTPRPLEVNMEEHLSAKINLTLTEGERVVYAQDNGIIVFIGTVKNHKKLQKISSPFDPNPNKLTDEEILEFNKQISDSDFDFQ